MRWKRKGLVKLRRIDRWFADESGVTAIEFALIAPVFLMMIFATLEIAFVVLFSALLHDGAAEAAKYLRDETMRCVRRGKLGDTLANCSAATMLGMRTAACAPFRYAGLSCDGQLRLAVYGADDLRQPLSLPKFVDDLPYAIRDSRAYIITIGYDWTLGLPTSQMLLVSDGSRTQLQARIYVSTAERTLR